MPRKKVPRDPIAVLSGGVVSETSHGGREDGAVVRENFLPLPVDRTLELRWDLGNGFPADGEPEIPDVAGARVKLVIFVAEESVMHLDRDGLRDRILSAGAKYCKAPVVHVVRKAEHRDARHAVDVPLEESLRLFAEETKPREAEDKVEFAAGLAREADAGEGS